MEYFWAKITKNGLPGKSVLSHMNDVRAVAEILLRNKVDFLKNNNCDDIERLAAFVGLHDIGKISPGFQMKCAEWLKHEGFEKEARNNRWDAIYETDHSRITQYALQNYLEISGLDSGSAEYWAAIAGSHHGRLYQPGIQKPKGINIGDKWDNWRIETIRTFLKSLPLSLCSIDNSWTLFWWIAGLISVADWIGSNENFFTPEVETKSEESVVIAAKALEAIGFNGLSIKPNLSFTDIFPFSPNVLQQKSAELIKQPGLYVIEAPMGIGKTEAALWCAYQLMQKRLASGIYFALPTQATSNRIHMRIQDFAAKIIDAPVRARLIHSGSWLLDGIEIPSVHSVTSKEKESTRDAIDWFASKKRALLAPVGVGTIDQALMSVIAVKHFFVRQFALSGKIIILDEVHSYDLYTGTLIKTLCDRLLSLGSTIIVLSATLTKKRKKQFLREKTNREKDEYPLISGKEFTLPVKLLERKTVAIATKNDKEALSGALDAAGKGASVLWICDTVNRAQEMFNHARQQNPKGIEIGLLHSRFPVFRRQQLEDYWMEKLDKEGRKRSRCILISTQVVEQSVDIDADLMVSELAPTDMLLQRMGRLWRHNRKNRPVDIPQFWLLAELYSMDKFKSSSVHEIKEMLGTKAVVYAPYVLLRTLEAWNNLLSLTLPADIRGILEKTYREKTKEPKSWQDLYKDMTGKADALKQFALFETNVWQKLLSDEEGLAKTRINDFPTTQLILVKNRDKEKVTLINDEEVLLSGDKFNISDARIIYRNIVKVPTSCFQGQSSNRTIDVLVRGSWQAGFVSGGNIECKNLKIGYRLRYSPGAGIEITRDKSNKEVEDEPSD